MKKLAILGSTRGTDMQAIIDAIESRELEAKIEIVISNKPDAYILERAKNHNLNTNCLILNKGETREEYDTRLLAELDKYNVDLILLIGWMRILSPVFINAFRDRILNVHPSLLPKFAGGMDLNVHEEVLKAHETESGCTVHLVDESVDSGKIIVQKKCSIDPNETAESLKNKVQKLEGEAFIEAIRRSS
ncbi:MAG: phosphoribosylglycinamide formyltransferase [Candidatus Magasanikiibacteriota bacterium]